MNRIKRTCALLLAIVLVLGAVLPSEIGGVFAEKNTEQAGQIAEQTTQAVTEPAIQTVADLANDAAADPVNDAVTDAANDPTADAANDPAADAATDAAADPVSDAVTDAANDPTADPANDPANDAANDPANDPAADAANDPTADAANDPATDAANDPTADPANDPATDAVTDPTEELVIDPTTDPTEELVIDPTTELTIDPETESEMDPSGELIALSFYEQLMACNSLTDFEALLSVGENAAALDVLTQEEWKQLVERVEELYAEIAGPTEADTLLKEELLKKLKEYITDVCPECGEIDGHTKDCSRYVEEYLWLELTDAELAAWLMDEANAGTVRDILTGDSEEAAALNARIEAILDGEDIELAIQLQKYLAALLGLDEPQVLVEGGYIYFDLAAGNVTFNKSNYEGYVFVGGSATKVTGTHAAGNKYYVYQSTGANRAETGYESDTEYSAGNCRIPEYPRVRNGAWGSYITNNTDVRKVSETWETDAAASGRTGTPNRITFSAGASYDVTIDDIWSDYHVKNVARSTGGIAADLRTDKNTTIRLRLKGDNRFGNVHYSSEKGSGNKIIFSNGEDGNQTAGSITVADFPDNFGANYWCSAIGSCDNNVDRSDGIVIESGVIYAGTTSADDCTAIGGGGNAYGGVTISGGTVTAVTASTGTAIGGGIGWGSQGGDANVVISGGRVYAYNMGIGTDSGAYTSFVPAVAIGGGSADTNFGNQDTTVRISGGFVYAKSVGGAAIGGGGSGTKTGGKATVEIEGGTVIAKSVGGTVTYTKKNSGKKTETISAGVSIGGGTGNTGGGSVNLQVSGGILRTGSIGGGKTTGTGNIGSATVNISDGDIVGQVIMAEGAAANCSFTMTGGRIHDTNVIEGNKITDIEDPQKDVPIQYIQENGGAVWMQDKNGVTKISGGIIEGCTAALGGAVYMEGGSFTLSGNGTVQKNTAVRLNSQKIQGYGGGVYIIDGNAGIAGGFIRENAAQIRGGGVYLEGGNVTVTDGSICENTAGVERAGESLPTEVGRGGGVYLEGGLFTMTGGEISGNTARYRGGGIFLKTAPDLKGGTISGNTAADSGGGLCINGDKLELASPAMEIFGNTAKNGGGIAVLNGNFILSGGNVGVEGQAPNDASENGGGVYVQAENNAAPADATVTDGNIWYNRARNGGGIYLASGGGNFTLDGASASVSYNEAANGGGIYLYKDPLLNRGIIGQNKAIEKDGDPATGNGGGMYISNCYVTLSPAGDVTIIQNSAKNGAGIYIHGLSGSTETTVSSDASIDAVSNATPANKVGLLVGPDYDGSVHFADNEAGESGGAVCVDVGYFVLESDKITVTGNRAVNGGGVAVLKGNFTMSAGSIGENGGANHAANGGGVYVSDGQVWLKGGSMKYNEATNGGGAYVTGGQFYMLDGSITNNTATKKDSDVTTGNGGGVYVAGDFRMQGGTIGGESGGNHAANGGGICVNDGNVTVVNGDITHNRATENGGGALISATTKEVAVVMLSGSLSSNQADVDGGGMAVISIDNQKKINVEIGCLLDHKVENSSPTLPIDYTGAVYSPYAEFDGMHYNHKSCPRVEHNRAGNIGGGFYMNSDASTLSFYCVEETQNTAQGTDTAGMDVVGGRVIIGDEHYHNCVHDDENKIDPHYNPWGYISMDDGTLVNGGQVDIYGDMTNPVFKNEVTVDIKETQNDHFLDHRRSKDGERYKVHYFENFQDKGLYQAIQYNEGKTTIDVQGALYSHPGYRILGWCTRPDKNDEEGHYYQVGTTIDLKAESVPGLGESNAECPYCGDQKDANLLVLYAIWEVNGYIVRFDPNVQQGDTYTGKMEDKIYNYGQKEPLPLNEYQYPGHFFQEWNTKADGSGTAYADGADGSELTEENGATVVLYAQWKPCKHDVSERWSYDVVNEKTLRRICSCGGQTLTATLHAADTVYDGNIHPATLTFNDEAAWGTDKPEITYTGEWLEDNLSHTGEGPELSEDGKPFHAGRYTAAIRKQGEKDAEEAKATISYTIAKADQSPPAKPTYKVADSKDSVNIDKLQPNEIENGATAEAEYRLTHYEDSGLVPTEWKKITDGTDTLNLSMETAWTSYNVEARYEELNDYNASKVVRADAEYYYEGNVTVKIICDEGINHVFTPTDGKNPTTNGAKLKLTTEADYYLIGGDYTVKTEVVKKDGGTVPADSPTVTREVNTGGYSEYSITNIPGNSILTITIGRARKRPEISAQVVPKQVFRSVAGTAQTTISRDSAFTAAFRIDNFDPWYTENGNTYGAYTGLKLAFAQAIPKETTVILLVHGKNGAKTYWYYRAGAEVNSVPLTDFRQMGGTEAYSIPRPAQDNGYVDLNYQFIVDFSQCTGGYTKDNSLTMTLEAETESSFTNVPAIKPEVKVSMEASGFTFNVKEDTNTLTRSFTCAFTEGAAASKWDNRASALVLTPDADVKLPPDARIKAEVEGGGTTWLFRNADSFIVPLSLLQAGEKTVNLTLQSALFPPEKDSSYSFTVRWLISASKAGKAPIGGDKAGELGNVVFTSAERVMPSLKSTGKYRVLTNRDALELELEGRKLDGYTVSAALLRKSETDGIYRETGWNATDVLTGETGNLKVLLSGQNPGCFCLMLTVKKNESITIEMKVPYYFIIREVQ